MRNARRFVLYSVLTEVSGFATTNGFLGTRFLVPVGETLWHFLRPGTMSSPPPWAASVERVLGVERWLLKLKLKLKRKLGG